MSIRHQITLILIALSAIFVTTSWLMQQFFIEPAFAALELESADKDLRRCIDALNAEMESLAELSGDWGAWDDAYEFTLNGSETFQTSNLIDETFTTADLDYLSVITKNGDVKWSDGINSQTGEHFDVQPINSLLTNDLREKTNFVTVDDSLSGLIETAQGPMLIASCPIVPSNRKGDPIGVMTMGRLLTKERISELAQRTHLDVSFLFRESEELTPRERRFLDGTAISKHIETSEDGSLSACTTLKDVSGRPLVLIRLSMSRTVTQQGAIAARAAMWCSLGGALMTALGTGMALRRRVMEPLQEMADHATRVGVQDDLDARIRFRRNDEIGKLAATFNLMVARLADSRDKLQEAAHRAGMAEIASEVLHNVGNAVNSAGCSVEMLTERLESSRLPGLDMAIALLSEQAPRAAEFFAHDPRGPKLIHYLETLNGTLQREHGECLSELRRLTETVAHIRSVITSQQDHARKSDFRQKVGLQELLDETLHINEQLLTGTGIRVHIEAPELPLLRINRSRISQVLVNLQKNAILSMLSVPNKEHVLTVSVREEAENTLAISVTDTGTGMTSEVQSRLFQQGFTTRSTGSGLGLHYCANVIRDIGGQISAYSSGPGTGATFRITIPGAITQPSPEEIAIRETPEPAEVPNASQPFAFS
ncbi:MAG: CHASE4 domain-containing protein [Planctomycetaceae bacterium]